VAELFGMAFDTRPAAAVLEAADSDDWGPLYAKLEAIEAMRQAYCG